ncbi:DUF2019 domain-containing protein [Allomesorhizobium camelthorni]|uniref:DUF2019 domain-containing protein n=1 Tax=Allomesorhizobium camelthorni TaxID=475069 RepID=A0A6G4WBF4_9HYPH|nr:DUF2019 domain-containing protein [Mesorhizobium camelthorni]NGO52125.1 DUF2019 domain-containing protein [Mesorhizobium camelthorni]
MTTKKSRAKSLASMSNAELVDLFEQLSLAEGEATAALQSSRANRLILRRRALLSEMRHRPGDARITLFVLYAHRHPQVRLNVAESTYALNPERARSTIEEIAASPFQPWSGDAGMSLIALENGTSQLPTDPE